MWVVEIPDDGMGGPADWDEVKEPCDGKHGPRNPSDAGLEAVDAYAFGALDSQDPESQSYSTEQDGEYSEAAGSLHVAGQSQQAIIHLTLDLTCALHYAIHPQAFPDDLSRHYVVAYKSSDPPQRNGTDHRTTHPANNGQDQAHQLHARCCHGGSCYLNQTDLTCFYLSLGSRESDQCPRIESTVCVAIKC